MKTVLIGFVFLASCICALAQSKRIGTFQFVETKHGHTAKIVFKTSAFNRSRHRIVSSREGLVSKIDGRAPLGTDGGIPQIEIESVRLYIDGKEVPVPKNL